MKSYFIRRLLLIPPTILGITLLVTIIMAIIPGGPLERELAKRLSGEGGQKSSQSREQKSAPITPSDLLGLMEKNNQHKHPIIHYLEWLGILPTDHNISASALQPGKNTTQIPVPGTTHEITATLHPDGTATITDPGKANLTTWALRVQTPAQQLQIWHKKMPKNFTPPADTPPRIILYQPIHDGLLQGSLGTSKKYQEPVWQIIRSKIPISLYYGIIELLLIYAICLPLGIIKAIKHRTLLDNTTSLLIFAGYSIPSYALAALIVQYICAKGYFPMSGFTSPDFHTFTPTQKITDLLHHSAMPLLCYLIGAFAFTTMMMKNSLMDHLAADYIRTAIAKGVTFPRAVFRHALRNSLIPIGTTLGSIVTIFITGNMLVEKIFDINGFGLLQYNSIVEIDQPLILGTLIISSFLMLLGNIISDLIVAVIDPKITYT